MPMRSLIVLALAVALSPVAAPARPWPGGQVGPGLGFEAGQGARDDFERGSLGRGRERERERYRDRDREAGRPRFDPPPPMRRSDQDYARDAMRAGAIRPLRDIARQWRGDMPGYDYIGSEYDPSAGSYRLKFLREGTVLWVDVDGRGREIRRSGR